MASNLRTSSKGTMESEPAVKAKGANKHLTLQNARATENWLRVKNVLDKQKKEISSKFEEDKSKLLKQREKMQFTSLSLTAVPEKDEGSSDKAKNQRRMTFADVYDALMMTMKEQRNQDSRSTSSEPTFRRGSTVSYDLKKVTRKPMSFSLQSLQKANMNLHNMQEVPENDSDDEETEQSEEKAGVFELSEEEKLLGPTLRLPPTALPPIHNQNVFKPQSRNFERRTKNNPDVKIEELRYCRYLRTGSREGRRSSVPAISPVRDRVPRNPLGRR
ncbi:uncharacterized protein LOC116613964 [Nematostella vectensis]|uniref:uncharacterized protein LOC116613964 n=1 Tax=Nematostella vectensis TaxID=45351 RepID=UPI002077536B|nr:uncharacterized protein LOC116613964 [Nematostella vectensis]